MKFKNYFKNLERYWSANFLALLSSTFLLTFIIWNLINLVSFAFQAASFSEYLKLICQTYLYGIEGLIMVFFPVACYLSACISIFYIFIIIAKKKWCIILSILPILIFFSKFFAETKDVITSPGFGDIIFFYLMPMTVLEVLISIGIYFILLLLELIPKFRVPQSLVSQNRIYKIFIQVFYWLYFIITSTALGFITYLLFLT